MTSPNILCIDDRPQVLELRKAFLELHNYCVKIESNVFSALKLLEEKSANIVLLEYKQEGMDAEAVAHHIRQRFPAVPIILLSAFANMPERILWLVDDYVLRSEMPDGLIQALDRKAHQHNLAKRAAA